MNGYRFGNVYIHKFDKEKYRLIGLGQAIRESEPSDMLDAVVILAPLDGGPPYLITLVSHFVGYLEHCPKDSESVANLEKNNKGHLLCMDAMRCRMRALEAYIVELGGNPDKEFPENDYIAT